jgi:hypothetical protein
MHMTTWKSCHPGVANTRRNNGLIGCSNAKKLLNFEEFFFGRFEPSGELGFGRDTAKLKGCR